MRSAIDDKRNVIEINIPIFPLKSHIILSTNQVNRMHNICSKDFQKNYMLKDLSQIHKHIKQ